MPLDPAWYDPDRPDARAIISRNEKKHKLLGWMEECFCVNCGVPGGMVTKDLAAHMFYLCNRCVWEVGDIPAPKIPEAVARGQEPLIGRARPESERG